MDDDFGIGFGLELMPLLDQFFAQFLVVIDFAIKDNPDEIDRILMEEFNVGKLK